MDLWSERRDFLESHGNLLLGSYRHWTGRDLIAPGDQASRRLFEAAFPVLSYGTDPDQTLNYANLCGLSLWEMSWTQLTSTPSRLTAEPVHQAERAAFLNRVRDAGVVDNYSGIRVSARGRRFRIRQATVWSVFAEAGDPAGVAATFSDWDLLPDREAI